MAQGTIVQSIGAVIDIEFAREEMPNIYDALVLEEAADNPLVEKGLTFEVEQQLARIWSELLGVPAIGVHDSFFDLGGHSVELAVGDVVVREDVALAHAALVGGEQMALGDVLDVDDAEIAGALVGGHHEAAVGQGGDLDGQPPDRQAGEARRQRRDLLGIDVRRELRLLPRSCPGRTGSAETDGPASSTKRDSPDPDGPAGTISGQ